MLRTLHFVAFAALIGAPALAHGESLPGAHGAFGGGLGFLAIAWIAATLGFGLALIAMRGRRRSAQRVRVERRPRDDGRRS